MPTHIFFGPATPAHMPPNTQTCICSCQHAQLPCSPTCTYPSHTTLLVYTNTYIRYHTGRPAHPSRRTCVGMHTHTSAHTNACTFTQHAHTHVYNNIQNRQPSPMHTLLHAHAYMPLHPGPPVHLRATTHIHACACTSTIHIYPSTYAPRVYMTNTHTY